MKRKKLVKIMLFLLIALLIMLGVVIGSKKMKSDDLKGSETEETQEEMTLGSEDEFEDVFEDEDEENSVHSKIKKENEEQEKKKSEPVTDESAYDDFKGIVLPDDEWE